MFPMHYSTQVTERLPAQDDVYTHDLGVRPLSVVLLNLKPLNDTGTLANWCNAFRIAQSVNRATILARGQAVVSMRGEDILAMNFYRWGFLPMLGNPDNVDNERRSLTLPIIMGRYPYSESSCFPAMGKGELTIELDLDIADTGYDGLRYSISTIELPNAKPTEFERRVQQTFTNPSTGNQDIDITIGNRIRGMLLWGTTGFDGASPAPSWMETTVLLDNAEAGYRAIPFEQLGTLQQLKGYQPLSVTEDDHMHTTTVDGNAQTAVSTLGGGGFTRASTYRNYGFLDFDPTGDDKYSLDTAGHNRLQLRTNVGTADAVRCVPIERMAVAGSVATA